MKNMTIRQETEKDYRAVEELTREAFWNVYKPGADEHYFVHMMRNHPDFIPELAFVLEKDGTSIEITLGSAEYVVEGDMVMKAAMPSELKGGKTYVSSEIFN